MSQVPTSLSATIPCRAVAEMPEAGGILLATAPAQGEDAPVNAMFVRVSSESVDVLNRNVVIATAPREDVESGCSEISIASDVNGTTAEFVGLTDDDGKPLVGEMMFDYRPQVVGIFTDLAGKSVPVCSSRWTSTPVLVEPHRGQADRDDRAILATLISLVALHRLDARTVVGPAASCRPAGGSSPRSTASSSAPSSAGTSSAPTPPTTATCSRWPARPSIGLHGQLLPLFGVPEAPFGWYYDVLPSWRRSPPRARDASARAPRRDPVLDGHQPRGDPAPTTAVRHNRVALWPAGLVFPLVSAAYNNGLRPEHDRRRRRAADLVLDQRAIGPRRLLPAASPPSSARSPLAAAPPD